MALEVKKFNMCKDHTEGAHTQWSVMSAIIIMKHHGRRLIGLLSPRGSRETPRPRGSRAAGQAPVSALRLLKDVPLCAFLNRASGSLAGKLKTEEKKLKLPSNGLCPINILVYSSKYFSDLKKCNHLI